MNKIYKCQICGECFHPKIDITTCYKCKKKNMENEKKVEKKGRRKKIQNNPRTNNNYYNTNQDSITINIPQSISDFIDKKHKNRSEYIASKFHEFINELRKIEKKIPNSKNMKVTTLSSYHFNDDDFKFIEYLVFGKRLFSSRSELMRVAVLYKIIEDIRNNTQELNDKINDKIIRKMEANPNGI